jgi:hypothetical protein
LSSDSAGPEELFLFQKKQQRVKKEAPLARYRKLN